MAIVSSSSSKPISSSTNLTPKDSPKRNLSPIRCSKSSKRVKCSKDQIFEEESSELDTKKSCHQCRQKAIFLVSSCTNQRNNKVCSIGFCRKCLLNRYEEKAEEVVLLSDWKCPKCRGICNCSQCMKKKGKQPTDMIVHAAKATGVSSATKILSMKEISNVNSTNAAQGFASSSDEVTIVASTTKSEKENSSVKGSDPDLEQKLVKEPFVASPDNFEKNSSLKKSVPNLQKKMRAKEPVLASMKKTGKENLRVGKTHPKSQVNTLTSYFSPKLVGECKRKNMENGNNNGNVCHGKEDPLLKDISKKSKVLKERNLNSYKNITKAEKRTPGVVAEVNISTKSCNFKDQPQTSIKEEEGVVVLNKKTDPQMIIYEDKSQDCMKKDGKVAEMNRSPSFHEKKMADSGNKGNDQVQSSPTLNFSKAEDLKMEKGDTSALAEIKTPKEFSVKPTSTKSSVVKKGFSMKEEKSTKPKAGLSATNDPQMQKPEEVQVEGNDSLSADENVINNSRKTVPSLNLAVCDLKNTRKYQDASLHADILLPQGTQLTNIAGIDLPPEDVGHALQFLEFCTAFGQYFHLKKGHAEAILRELTRSCTRRTRTLNQYSSVVQFHIQLLSLLLKDSGEQSPSLSPTSGGSSWFQALGKCVTESEYIFDELPSNCFNKDGSGYYMLDSSRKLRLLNFLCNEALCTADLRTWIDKQSSISFEKEKEARQKVLVAKEKEKRVRQQMKDEMEKAIVNGTSISISEHDELVSKMKKEAENAHNEMLEAMKNIPNKKQISALRTDSTLFDGNGHVFWRLKSYTGQPDILVQDIGSLDPVNVEDKWFTYDGEQKGIVEKYISLRGKRVRLQKVSNVSPSDQGAEEMN